MPMLRLFQLVHFLKQTRCRCQGSQKLTNEVFNEYEPMKSKNKYHIFWTNDTRMKVIATVSYLYNSHTLQLSWRFEFANSMAQLSSTDIWWVD